MGFAENMDIVERVCVTELVSLSTHGLVKSDAEVRADSLTRRACFDGGAVGNDGCPGTLRLGLLGLGVRCCKFVSRTADACSAVKAGRSGDGLFRKMLALILETSMFHEAQNHRTKDILRVAMIDVSCRGERL